MWWFLLVACRSQPQTWVAHGDEASVGVTTDSGRVLAYVCGNDEQTRQEWSRWFAGELTGGGFVLERESWLLRGVPVDGGLEIELDGPGYETASSWNASRISEGGVYEHVAGCRDGAIAGGGEVVGTWCDAGGVRHQVEPADTVFDLGDVLDLVGPEGDLVFDRAHP